MSKKETTNDVLLERINAIHTLTNTKLGFVEKQLKDINTHLSTLNGQVAKNTKFRERMQWGWRLACIIGTIVVAVSGVFVGIVKAFAG